MTFTANQRLTIVLNVLAVVILTALLSYNIGKDDTTLSERVMTECEVVPAGSDVGPILESYGYSLELISENDFGSPQYLAYSPGCSQ